jgi:D-glycero-D-manno-heptose 1,7-bisphosphate phosphatase
MNRAVFLDRDGVIIHDKNYLSKPEDVEFIAGAFEGLRLLQENGFLLIIVTNQSGIGRGYFTIDDMNRVHEYIASKCAEHGIRFARIYYAPEAPGQPSYGRKPSPRFLFDAQKEFKVDLSRSYMIGDKLVDLECGWNAGVRRCILVRTGYGSELEKSQPQAIKDAVIVNDISEAASWILSDIEDHGSERS